MIAKLEWTQSNAQQILHRTITESHNKINTANPPIKVIVSSIYSWSCHLNLFCIYFRCLHSHHLLSRLLFACQKYLKDEDLVTPLGLITRLVLGNKIFVEQFCSAVRDLKVYMAYLFRTPQKHDDRLKYKVSTHKNMQTVYLWSQRY